MLLGVTLVGNEQGDIACFPRLIIRGGNLIALEIYFTVQVLVLPPPCGVMWDDHFSAPGIPHPIDPTCPGLPDTFLALALKIPHPRKPYLSVRWK